MHNWLMMVKWLNHDEDEYESNFMLKIVTCFIMLFYYHIAAY
jgi:hypothetical protein